MKKFTPPPPKAAVRTVLRNFAYKNRAESRRITQKELEHQVRLCVQNNYPALPPAEVERRVQRRIERGMRPCR